MQPTILLEGELFPDKIRKFWGEIESYKNDPHFNPEKGINIILASSGGNCALTLEILKKINALPFPLFSKIYRAESSAALIALASKECEMTRDGIFTIHLGSIRLEASDLSAEGKVPEKVSEMLEMLQDTTLFLLNKKMGQKRNTLENKLSKLLASNSLTLSSSECLEMGIIEKII